MKTLKQIAKKNAGSLREWISRDERKSYIKGFIDGAIECSDMILIRK